MTALDTAREIARSYRSALHQADPQRCAELDARAKELGQWWITPVDIPAHLIPDALDAELSAGDIQHFWGVPAETIYGWASKGLLEKRPGQRGPVYLVRDVLACEARRRRKVHDSRWATLRLGYLTLAPPSGKLGSSSTTVPENPHDAIS